MAGDLQFEIRYLPEDARLGKKLSREMAHQLPNVFIRVAPLFTGSEPEPSTFGPIVIPVTARSLNSFQVWELDRRIAAGQLGDKVIVVLDRAAESQLSFIRNATTIVTDINSKKIKHGLYDALISLLAPLDHDSQEYVAPHILLSKISSLGLSRRVANIFKQDNMIYLGDLIQRTEAELYRFPSLGPEAMREIKAAILPLGVRLGMNPAGWPPDDIEDQLDLIAASEKLAAVKQEPLGAMFEATPDALVINASGTIDDAHAVERPLVQQLHTEIIRKAGRFSAVATRLDNQMGWQGIAAYCERLLSLLGRPTADIPDVLGTLYSATLELGTYLEMDRAVESGASTFAVPLDPEVRRPLEDLIASMAPWMRSFPSIRELDDEAGQFLSRIHLLDSSANLVSAATQTRVLAREDVLVLQGLIDAAGRGEFQGHKANKRSVSSARNMVLTAATVVASFMAGATSSDYATKSVVVQRAGDLLAKAEEDILQLFADVPDDVRLAVEIMLRGARTLPPDTTPPLPAAPPSQAPVRAATIQRRKAE